MDERSLYSYDHVYRVSAYVFFTFIVVRDAQKKRRSVPFALLKIHSDNKIEELFEMQGQEEKKGKY